MEPPREPPSPRRRAGLPAARRLKWRRLIRPLFDRARTDVGSVSGGCIRLVYRVVPRAETGTGAPVQAGFSAGRAARHATARNRIKRILREVYRVRQHALVDLFLCSEDALTLMVVFRGNPHTAPQDIRRDLPDVLRRLALRLSR